MALVHRWPLTADANDIVGSLNLTNNGGVTFDPVNGANFNGTNQSLSGIYTLTNPFSISVWVKFSNVTQSCSPIFFCSSVPDQRAGMAFETGNAEAYVGNVVTTSASSFTAINYPPTVDVLCSMTYDSTTLRFYRGTTLIVSAARSFNTNAVTFALSRLGPYNGYYLAGSELDLRFYTDAIDSQIPALNLAGPNNRMSYFPQVI